MGGFPTPLCSTGGTPARKWLDLSKVSAQRRKVKYYFLSNENQIAKEIVDVAYKIHTTLGSGLLESVYQTVLVYELEKRGLNFVRQQPIPVVYKRVRLEEGFRADIIVENKVIIEIKSPEAVAPVHKKQLLTYLRLTNLRLGLLINFNALIRDGITRIANGL